MGFIIGHSSNINLLICIIRSIYSSLEKHVSDFKDDPELYVYPNLKYVGIELWQVTFQFDLTSLC